MTSAMTESCPVCSASPVTTFLRHERVPVHQHLVMPTPQQARAIHRGCLEMAYCSRCGFAFNRAFDADLLDYGDEYDNTQSHSPSFKAYMDELVHHMISDAGVQGQRIVEVGCGKGGFIRALLEADPTSTGWGFDPSYLGPDTALDGRLTFKREFYGPGCEDLRADVVVCRHVIEHVSNPVALLETVRAALSLSPRARVFFETPALDWILDNVVIWDFFYEHCSLFTAGSLTTTFERAGFRVDRITTTFGGQYLWLEASLATVDHEPRYEPGTVPQSGRRFALEEQRWVEGWAARLSVLRERGMVAIWGAGAKGVTFANLIDPDATLIDCVVDLNPHKQGRYLPGTGHAIIAPGLLGERGVTTAILMNPNYRVENVELLESLGLRVALEDHLEIG